MPGDLNATKFDWTCIRFRLGHSWVLAKGLIGRGVRMIWGWHVKASVERDVEDSLDHVTEGLSGFLLEEMEACAKKRGHPDEFPRHMRVRAFPIVEWQGGAVYLFFADVGNDVLLALHVRREDDEDGGRRNRKHRPSAQGWKDGQQRLAEVEGQGNRGW